jgi:hypothetical protein
MERPRSGRTDVTQDDAVIRTEEAVGPGTALVPLFSSTGAPTCRRGPAHAPLVAQLLATRLDAPQTRSRRRAENAEGVAVYGAAGQSIQIGKRVRGESWSA